MDRRVWLTEDYFDLPEGSCLMVLDESTNEDGELYIDGMWSSMAGSYFVTVPASITTAVDPDAEMNEAIAKYLASDQFKETQAYRWLQEQKKHG